MQSNNARTSASSEPLYSFDSSPFYFSSLMNDQESGTSIGHGDDVLAATQSQHYPMPLDNTAWVQQWNINPSYELETRMPQMQNKEDPWDPLPAQMQQRRAAPSMPNQHSSSQPIMPNYQTPMDDWTQSNPGLDFNTFRSSQPTSDGSHLRSNYDYTQFAFGDGMGRSPQSIPRYLPESSYTASTGASEAELIAEGDGFYQQPDDNMFPGNQSAQAGINLDADMEDAPSFNYATSAVPPMDLGIGDHLLPQRFSYSGNPSTGSLPTGNLHQSFNAANISMDAPTSSQSPKPTISFSQLFPNIADRRSSSRHEGDVPGSYPPTAHHYPVQHSSGQLRLKDDSRARPRSLTLPQNPLNASASRIGGTRRRSSNTGSNLNGRNKTLEAIDEDLEARASGETALVEGEGDETFAPPMVRSASGRPRRDGPLPEDVRRQTGERRRDKKICIPCKATRISCDKYDEDVSCESCSKSRKALVCVPAEWSKHVLPASCDSLFHRTIQFQNSLTGMPATKTLPPTFPLSHMLNTLHRIRDHFRIRVRHVSSFSYYLDLDTCYGLLSCLKKPEFELKDVFHGGKVLEIAEKWADAVIECAAGTTEAERLSSCLLMPGMADFELVPYQTAKLPRWAHEDFRAFAANLNRIPLRAIEILGHNALQKACNSLFQTSPKMDAVKMAELGRDLGKVVCSQRLRQAWSSLHDHPLSYEQQRSAAHLECLTHVTRSLYFWYIRVQKKIDRKVDLSHNSQQNYFEINGRRVADPLPVIESEEQYQAWCRHGQAVLFAAGLGGQAPFSSTYRPSLATAAPLSGMH